MNVILGALMIFLIDRLKYASRTIDYAHILATKDTKSTMTLRIYSVPVPVNGLLFLKLQSRISAHVC